MQGTEKIGEPESLPDSEYQVREARTSNMLRNGGFPGGGSPQGAWGLPPVIPSGITGSVSSSYRPVITKYRTHVATPLTETGSIPQCVLEPVIPRFGKVCR